MAWSATFLADFTQWDAALRQAEAKLGNFEQSTQKTKNTLQKMVSEFDGTKIIQQSGTMAEAIQRAGGAATLTDKELKRVNDTLQEALQKYQRMGQDAPKSLTSMADAVKAQLGPLDQASQKTTMWGSAIGSVKNVALGFVAGFTLDRMIGSIGSAVTSTIEWGGRMTDLSAKVGVSTDALQKWEFAANRSGNTLDQLVQASGQLSRRLAEGDKSTVAAIEKLGLSFEHVRGMSPERQLETVADALKRVGDQGEFAAIGADLMGRGFIEVAPTIRAGLKEVGDEAQRLGAIVHQETLEAFDALGDTWGDLKIIGRGLIAEVLQPMVPLLKEMAQGFASLNQPGSLTFLEYWAIATGNPIAKIVAGSMAGDRNAKHRTDIALSPGGRIFDNYDLPYDAELDKAAPAVREMSHASKDAATSLRALAQSSAILRDVNIRDASRHGGVSIFQGLPGLPSSRLYAGTAVLGGQSNPWGGVGYTGNLGYTPTTFDTGSSSSFSVSRFGLAGLNAAMPFLSQLATGGSRGGQIGGSLAGSFGGAIGSLFSGATGALGAIAPFLGPLAGIAGGLIGRLFGPSRGAVLGREADQRMDQTRAGLLQQYGSLDAIAATGSAGAALVAGWEHKNVAGERQFDALVKAFERQNQLLGEQKGLQSEIAGIEAQRAAIEDGLKTTWEQVVSIAERYGISLEGLGEKVQQLGATTTWTSMLNDIEALVRAGGDLGGILVGMQDEMSAMVEESRRLGTEIPLNMKPYLEELVRSGKLLDANGDAITDLSGIKWGDPVKTQADIAREAMEKLDEAMQKLVARLEQIVDLLANKLPAAAEQGARGAGGSVSGIEPGVRVDYDSENSFASGSGGVRDFGGGTLAMLHGREAVLTEAQLRAVTSGAGMTIQPAQVVLDRRVLGEIMFELLPSVAARRGLVPGMAY